MAHYYDREFDVKEKRSQEIKWKDICEDALSELDDFLLLVKGYEINIPSLVDQGIEANKRKYSRYIEEANMKIEKADRLLLAGKLVVGYEEW